MVSSDQMAQIDFSLYTDLLNLFLPSDQELLRRCATARSFDRKLFDRVLHHGLEAEAMPFEALVSYYFVEALPGPGENYHLRGDFPRKVFETWWQVGEKAAIQVKSEIPAGLRALSRQLAEYYLAQDNELEGLYHLAAANRNAASALLNRLFDEADEQFDLSRCTAIVHALEERQELLGPSLARLLRQKRMRLQTRSMWAKEFYETVVYYERQETRTLFDDLVKAKKRWILHLYAPGGMGKTMYIRSVIARICVPKDIPCARIDFDFVPHLANVANEPWLLILNIAQQLTLQIPDNPFAELLNDFALFIGKTDRHPVNASQEFNQLNDYERASIRENVTNRFLGTLQDVWSRRHVVLIFDTLENLYHRQIDMAAIYDLLENIHAHFSPLRVIFAGRINLSQRTAMAGQETSEETQPDTEKSFALRFPEQYFATTFQGFSDKEARVYLEEKRKVNTSLIDAVLSKAKVQQDERANPFKLALLADVVRANPEIAAEQIYAYPDADLAYLIERVIERIHIGEVKWLIRYGVTPRLLTLDYMRRVMIPQMRIVLGGDTRNDDATKDHVPESRLGRKPFVVDLRPADREIDIDALWGNLYQYTGESSWISAASEVPGALIFHPDVVEPMRNILKQHLEEDRPILTQLHRASIEYFEACARDDPRHRGRWLLEALYHKLQLCDQDASAYLSEKVEVVASDLLKDTALIQELTGPDAKKDLGAIACYGLAYVSLADKWSPSETECLECERWLQQAEKLNAASGFVVHPSRLEYLRGRLELARGQHEHALVTGSDALKHPADEANEYDLRLLAAQTTYELSRPEALELYRLASNLVKNVDSRRAEQIIPLWTAALEAFEEYEQAEILYNDGQRKALNAGDLEKMGEYIVARIRMDIAMGQEARAVKVGVQGLKSWLNASQKIPYQLPRSSTWPARLRAEIELARQQPRLAWRELEQIRQQKSYREIRQDIAWFSIETMLRARICAALFDIRQAVSLLDEAARSIYGQQTKESMDCLLECARLLLEETGDLEQSAKYLELAEAYAPENKDEIQPELIRRELLLIQLLSRQGGQNQALLAAQALAKRYQLPARNKLKAQVALEVFIQSGGKENCLDLGQALAQTKPASQRLALLGELHRCPTPQQEWTTSASKLLDGLPLPDSEHLDRTLALLRLVEIHRVAGQVVTARRLLQKANTTSHPKRLTLLRQVYLAYDRLGWEPNVLKKVELSKILDQIGEDNPYICGLMLLEHAERIYRVLHDYKRANQLLEEASTILKQPSSPWSARIAALKARIAWQSGDDQTAEFEAQQAIDRFRILGYQDVSVEALRADLIARDIDIQPTGESVIETTTREPEPVIDFLLVTTLKQDCSAVLTKLPGYHKLQPQQADIHTYYQAKLDAVFSDGSSGDYHIIVMPLSGRGQIQAAAAISDAVRRWKTRYVVLIGIAGGVAASGVKVGDILISNKIIDYKFSKTVEQGPQVRHDVHNADIRLLTACQASAAKSWQKLMIVKRPVQGKPLCHFGAIASIDKAIASNIVLDKYLKPSQKLIGIETETSGVASAAFRSPDRPGFIMVRGASDLADEQHMTDTSKWRSYASDAAAAFTIAFLQSGPVEPSAAKDAKKKRTETRGKIRIVKGKAEAVARLFIRLERKLDTPNELLVSYHNGQQAWQRETTSSGLLQKLTQFTTMQDFSYVFAKDFTRAWPILLDEMADILFPAQERMALQEIEQPVDIRLEFTDRQLAYLPWEFLHLIKANTSSLKLLDRCRYLSRYVASPYTFQSQPSLTRPANVLIVRASEEQEKMIMRGHNQAGIGLARFYRKEGIKVDELFQPDISEVMNTLSEMIPSILHIVCSVREGRDRLYLSLGGERLDLEMLGDLLGGQRAAPLIILDVPTPPGITERARQLCLRNAFISQWIAKGEPAAILATGLGDVEQQTLMNKTLTSLLARGASIGEVTRQIGALAPMNHPLPSIDSDESESGWRLGQFLPFLGTALFTHNPEQCFSKGM